MGINWQLVVRHKFARCRIAYDQSSLVQPYAILQRRQSDLNQEHYVQNCTCRNFNLEHTQLGKTLSAPWQITSSRWQLVWLGYGLRRQSYHWPRCEVLTFLKIFNLEAAAACNHLALSRWSACCRLAISESEPCSVVCSPWARHTRADFWGPRQPSSICILVRSRHSPAGLVK